MAEQKRVDPSDGTAYTFEELVAYYKDTFSRKEVTKYWVEQCTRLEPSPSPSPTHRTWKKGKRERRKADEESEEKAESPPAPAKPQLRRTRSWLRKVEGIALLPCEEHLSALVEKHAACVKAKDLPGVDATQLQLLREHPFVTQTEKPVPAGALAADVTATAVNFRMNVNKFKKWLGTAEGKPFEEKGKGYDDGCYLTSGLLRAFMPRGFTHFGFKSSSGEEASVFLRGFFKFTGLTAADEDEESNVTSEAASFMFHGYTMDDASRFVVTVKSNGENGKYSVRRILGEWYCFAGSKNTGVVWKLGSDVSALYPIPEREPIAAVGPKIVAHANGIICGMAEKDKSDFLSAVQDQNLTVMVEFNDDTHEHIFPIDASLLDHVAILDASGFPLPQRDAYTFFDKFGMRRDKCDVYEDVSKLSGVMDGIRTSKDTEGAVIYLERSDDVAVGLIKVKSDHYVVARRTREILRSSLINASKGKSNLASELEKTEERLRKGMKALMHVGGCAEHHEAWAAHAIAFASSWATAFNEGDAAMKKALVTEFHAKFGSLYERFYRTKTVLPLSKHSLEVCGEICENGKPPGSSPKAESRDRKQRGKQ